MGVEDFLKQEEQRFIRENLMSDEVFDFIRENTMPFNRDYQDKNKVNRRNY